MTPTGVLDELRRRHAYGMLVRGGARPKTSRYPGRLEAAITVLDVPRELRRNEACAVDVDVVNVGDSIWLSEASTLGGFVTVGCKLLHPNGRLVNDAIGRTTLPTDVHPGQKIQVTMPLWISDRVAAGSYILRIDLVNELVAWFSDLPGNHPHECAITLR